MTTLQILTVIICLFFALLTIPASILINMFERGTASYRKVGGLRFIKIGRLSISFSIAKAPLTAREKQIRAAYRRESRAELHYNAKIGRRVRYERLQILARRQTESMIRGFQPWVPAEYKQELRELAR